MYYFVSHGKKKKKCYLDPVERYKYASTTHTFPLRGLAYKDREEEYLLNLVDTLISRLERFEREEKHEKALETLRSVGLHLISTLKELSEDEEIDATIRAKIKDSLNELANLLKTYV